MDTVIFLGWAQARARWPSETSTHKFRARLKPNWGDTSGIPLGTPPCNLPKSRQSATCHTIWSKYDKGSFRSLSTDIQSVACRVPCIPSPARVWLVIPWGSRYESTDCPMCEAHMKQLNNNKGIFTYPWYTDIQGVYFLGLWLGFPDIMISYHMVWDFAVNIKVYRLCNGYHFYMGMFAGISLVFQWNMKYVEIPWKYPGSTLDLETPKYWVFAGNTWKYLRSSHFNNMR